MHMTTTALSSFKPESLICAECTSEFLQIPPSWRLCPILLRFLWINKPATIFWRWICLFPLKWETVIVATTTQNEIG